MQLERTIDDKGRYLGYFDRKEEAEEFVDEQVRRYLFTPNPKKMSIRRICKEANDRGIKLHPNSFAKELRRRDIEIRDSRNRIKTTKRRTYTISNDSDEQLNEYPSGSKSYIVDLGIRIATGLPTEDVVMFIPEEEGQVTLIFEKKAESRYRLYVSGELDMKFRQQIRKLLTRAEDQGSEAIIRYAEQHGYTYYGASY